MLKKTIIVLETFHKNYMKLRKLMLTSLYPANCKDCSTVRCLQTILKKKAKFVQYARIVVMISFDKIMEHYVAASPLL